MSVVADASLVVAAIVADERQEAVRSRMQRWFEAGVTLHAPGVLPYEVANVLARRVFDGHLDLDEVAGIWRDVEALGVVLHPVEPSHDGHAVGAVTAQLRRRHATDSAYVALAQRLGTAVWTLDGALARNATDLGLPVQVVA